MSKGIQSRIGYAVMSMQDAFNAGINGFAALLVAESFGDKMEEKFPEGGILFCCLEDHKKRPIWLMVTHEAPMIIEVDDAAQNANDLLAKLVRGIEWWASREDGIPEEIAADYVAARYMLGWEYATDIQRNALAAAAEQQGMHPLVDPEAA